MSIQKIKESELTQNGISALSTHPALPSLYEGRNLSAEELRAAFDKLPRLLAERFNALIDALDLVDTQTPPERLSAAIATDFWEGHSLADLFADIKSGAFYGYITTDGTQKLAALIDGLLARTVLPEGYETLHDYVDAPQGELLAEETRPVSGGKILQKIMDTKRSTIQETENIYRLSHIEGNPLTLCLEVYRSAQRTWRQIGVSLNIPTDAVIKSGVLRTCAENGVPDKSLVAGDKYLDFTLAGESETHVYVCVSDLIDTVATQESGSGDIVTSIRHEKNKIIAQKGLSSSNFAVKNDIAVLKEDIGRVEAISADKTSLAALDLRLSLVEETVAGKLYYYFTESNTAYNPVVPQNALPYASVVSIGGASACRNLFEEASCGTSFTGITAAWDASRACIHLNGTLSANSLPLVLHMSPIQAKGRTFSFSYRNVGGSFSASDALPLVAFYSGYDATMPANGFGECEMPLNNQLATAENVAFYSTENAPSETLDTLVVSFSASNEASYVTFNNYCLQIQVEVGKSATPYHPFGWHHTPVSEIAVTGKNLLPDTVYDFSAWRLTVNNSIYPLQLTAGTPYVISADVLAGNESLSKYFYLQRSNDDWQTRETIHLLAAQANHLPYAFTAEEGYEYRLYCAQATHAVLTNIQLEVGEIATAYEPYTVTSLPIPAEVTSLDGYGMGIGSLQNYLDFTKKRYVQNVGMRAFQEGDFEDGTVITDGTKTLAPLASPRITDLSIVPTLENYLTVSPGANILFENAEKRPVPYKIDYQLKLFG